MKKNKKTVGIFVSIVLAVGIGFSYLMTNADEEQDDKRMVLATWSFHMEAGYANWSSSLTEALATGSSEETLAYLEEVESIEPNGWLDANIFKMSGIETDEESYSKQDRYTYGYIRYLIDTWEERGLSEQEAEIVSVIQQYAEKSKSAYNEMKSFYKTGDSYEEKVEERLQKLREETAPLRKKVREADGFREYERSHSKSFPEDSLFAGENVPGPDELREKTKLQSESVLEKELTLTRGTSGTGHSYTDSGAQEVVHFNSEKDEYRIAVTSVGGHLLGITMDSPEVYPVQSDLNEVTLRMARSAEIPGEDWKTRTRELEDEVKVFLYQKDIGVEKRNYPVEATFQKLEEAYALMSIDFSFAYKNESSQDTSAAISPEEAEEALSSNITVEGEPKLAQISSSGKQDLVYIFGISGIEGYSEAFVDARSGEFIRVR